MLCTRPPALLATSRSSCNFSIPHVLKTLHKANVGWPCFRRAGHTCCGPLKEEAQKQKKPHSLRQGIAAYSMLARHATTLGPRVLLEMLIAAIKKFKQGFYAAVAAALVTAVANDKIEEIANICAEIMRLGWVKLGSSTVIACLRQGYLRQTLPVLGVLIRQQDTDVLVQTIQGVTRLGSKAEAAEVRQILLDEGYEFGRQFSTVNQNTPRNAEEAKQAALSFAATASATLAGAVAGVADSVVPDEMQVKSARHASSGSA